MKTPLYSKKKNSSFLVENILLGICFLFSMVSCSGQQTQEESRSSLDREYAVKDLKEDYEQLIGIMKNNHPALYDFTNKQEFEELINLQSGKFTSPMNLSEFYKILSPVVTAIGCGHSSVNLPN